MRPRPTPLAPIRPDDQTEFDRPEDYQLRSGGPRDFARMTHGSKMIGGQSQVLKQEKP